MTNNIEAESTFQGMLCSENGQGISRAILVDLIPKGIQAEAVRRFNIHAENWNEITVGRQSDRLYGGLI